jgi:cell division septum initiation protein DivIVA
MTSAELQKVEVEVDNPKLLREIEDLRKQNDELMQKLNQMLKDHELEKQTIADHH